MNEKFLASSPSAVIESTAEQMGFQPVESAVVVALVGRTVAFCARMDLADAVEASTGVTPALDSTGADGVLLVGYSQRPEWAAGVLHTLASGVLDGLVITQHITDEKTAWRCDGGQLLDGEPVTASLPQASRDDVVAVVTAERQPTALNVAMGRIAALDSMQRTLALTAALACDPSPEQAAEASAILAASPEHFIDAADSIVLDPHSAFRALCAMRRWCADEHLYDTLSMLTVAAWASHNGAAVTNVLLELEAHAPDSPAVGMLGNLIRTSPALWLATMSAV